MIYLVDTNVLLCLLHTTNPDYATVQSAVNKLWANNDELKTTSQNFAEFWRVSTKSTVKNGYGLDISQTDQLLLRAEKIFPLLTDSPAIYHEWRRLVVKYNVSALQTFDARLVASMISNGVTHILTFNTKDFVRYRHEGIVVVDPAMV